MSSTQQLGKVAAQKLRAPINSLADRQRIREQRVEASGDKARRDSDDPFVFALKFIQWLCALTLTGAIYAYNKGYITELKVPALGAYLAYSQPKNHKHRCFDRWEDFDRALWSEDGDPWNHLRPTFTTFLRCVRSEVGFEPDTPYYNILPQDVHYRSQEWRRLRREFFMQRISQQQQGSSSQALSP